MDNSPEFERRRAALIAEIEAAFDGVPREDGTTLHEAEAMDDYKSEDEQHAARRLDQEGRWQDVPDEAIGPRHSALSFMDAKGLRYYLPAFMLYGLRHWREIKNDAVHACEYHLLHEPGKSLRQSEPALIAAKLQLTGAQCRAVASFLRFVIDFHLLSADRATVQAVEKWEHFCARD